MRSYRTSVSTIKLCDVDQTVWEYLLYVLLDLCWRAKKRVNLPEGLPWQDHPPEQWQALGHSLDLAQATQFWMPTAVERVLQHAHSVVQQAQSALPRQKMQNVPVQRTGAVMLLVSQLVHYLGGVLAAAGSAAVGARVLEARTGRFPVDPLNRQFDELCVVPCTPGGLYWHLGLNNYAIWARDDSGT